VKFGAYVEAGRASRIINQIAADFISTGTIPAEIAPNLADARWHKLVWNIPFNAFTVLLGYDTSRLLEDAAMVEESRAVMKEIVEGAARCGIHIAEEFVDKMIDDTRTMVPYFPSMKLDYDAKKPMEVESIFGEPVRRMKLAGFDAPKITMLYNSLKFLDARNTKNL
jgi:2-dehydropantoate 2-reductase